MRVSYFLLTALLLAGSLSMPTLADTDIRRTVSPKIVVTVSAPDRTIDDILRQLSRSAGVTLEASSHLGRSYACLVARDRPLTEVMGEMASLCGTAPGRCVWQSARQNGTGSFVLTESSASKGARLTLVRHTQEETIARARRAVSMARLSDEELVRARDSSPTLIAAMPGLRPYFALFTEMPPIAVAKAAGGTPVELAYDDLTPAQQEILRRMVAHTGGSHGRRLPDGTREIIESFDGSKDYVRCRIVLRPSGSPERPGLVPRFISS